MRKKSGAVLLLCFIFLVFMPMAVLAADDWQDIYKAYGIDRADPEAKNLLSEKMLDNPPQAIAIKLDRFGGFHDSVPLTGEIIVELGGRASFGPISFQFTETEKTKYEYDVTLTARYEKEDDAASLRWDTEVHLTGSDYRYIFAAHESQWVAIPEATYNASFDSGLLTWDENYISLKTHDRDPQNPKNVPRGLGEIHFQIERVKVNPGGLSGIISNFAGETAGETSVPIATAIVVGILGIAAAGAAAGAGAVSGGGDGGMEETDENGSTYKMYVYKEFGDKIKYNGDTVFVYARIAEVTKEGGELERPDLTQQIEIFSRDAFLSIGSAVMSGSYMGASVEAVAEKGTGMPQEGTVSFKFTGEGGTFQNNVVFKLVGEPYVRFPERGDSLFATVNMLYGDQGVYAFPVEFCDFISPVEKVALTVPDGRPVEVSAEKIGDARYMLHLINQSAKPEGKLFKTESFDIEVTGENETERAKERLRVVLQPEGLSVRDLGSQFDDKGYFRVSCYPDADSPGSAEVVPTRFVLQLAVSGTDPQGRTKVKVVPPGEYTPVFAPLRGIDAETNTLVSRYPCEINPVDGGKNGAYRFEPKRSLPEPEDSRFHVVLPVTAGYGGESYRLELDVRLIGEPLDPMAGWDEEYALLQKRIERYGLSQDMAMRMRALCGNRSTSELRLLSKMILMEAAAYYTRDSKEYNDIADRLQTIESGLGVLKWFGDQAFSILMTMYAGPMGEAVITPAKEIVVALIGEVGTQIISGESFDFESLQVSNNISAVFEGYLLNMIGEPDVSLKKAGVVIAGFAVFNLAKHYILDTDEKGNRDFYRAITSAFGDLTVTTVKIAAGRYFDKLAGNQKIAQKLNGWTGQWLHKNLPDMAWQRSGQDILTGGLTEQTAYILTKTDILKKYLEEFIGIGAAKVYSSINEANEEADVTFDSNAYVLRIPVYPGSDGPDSTIYVTIDLLKVKDALFDYVFDIIFGSLPLPGNPMQVPADPPYMTSTGI